MNEGMKIKMCGERCRYTVQAFDERFIVATRPHFGTYMYTLIDRQQHIRGPLNTVLGLPCDVNSPEGAIELLTDWMQGNGGYEVWHVSRRNNLPLTKPEIEQIN